MRAGRLRHRGTIEHYVEGSPSFSPSGEPLAEWTELITTWMSVEPLRGRELFIAQEHHSETEVRIRIRYREGITPQMRVLHEGKYYEILSVVDPDMRHRELELMAREGVSNA